MRCNYTQSKKTMNTEDIPGMCVLTNHMRDLVTAENEWVSGQGIELVLDSFRKTSHLKPPNPPPPSGMTGAITFYANDSQ